MLFSTPVLTSSFVVSILFPQKKKNGVKYLFLFGGKLAKVGANMLYLLGQTCRGASELVG